MGVRIALSLQILDVMKIINYIKETYDELVNKVSWPTWKELQNSVVVVSVASLIIALIVYLMDAAFGGGMSLLFPTGNIFFSI